MEVQLCKYCRNEIKLGATICTNCGKNQNRALSSLTTLSAVSAGVAIVLAALTYLSSSLPDVLREFFITHEVTVIAASVDEDSYSAVLRNNLSEEVFIGEFVAYFPNRMNPTSSYAVGVRNVLKPNQTWTFESDNERWDEHYADCGGLTAISRLHLTKEGLERLNRFSMSPMSTDCFLARLLYPREQFLDNVARHYRGLENIYSFEHELYLRYYSTRHDRWELLEIESFAIILANPRTNWNN